MVEVGLPFEEAEEMIEANKKQIQTYGSRVDEAAVGFYIRRHTKDMLGTGKDYICLVTGMIKQVHTPRLSAVACACQPVYSVQACSASCYDACMCVVILSTCCC
jgi:hypothetical protein